MTKKKKKFQAKEITKHEYIGSLIGINVSQDGCKFSSTLKQLTCLSCVQARAQFPNSLFFFDR